LQLLAEEGKEQTKQICDAIKGSNFVRHDEGPVFKRTLLTAVGTAEIAPLPPAPAAFERQV